MNRSVFTRFAVLLAVLLLGACGEPFAITKPDPYYPASSKVAPDERHVWKVVDLRPYQEALFVRHLDPNSLVKPLQGGLPTPISTIRGRPATWVATPDDIYEFMRASFENIGYFKVVKHYEQLEDSPQRERENHLVADYAVDWAGGYDYTFHVRILDPRNNDVLFQVSHYHYRFWPSLDRPLFFPVFNAIIEWKDECLATYARPLSPNPRVEQTP